MPTTVISTIDDPKNAQKLINELAKAGFKDQDVEILEGNETKIVAAIVARGFDEDDARGYAQAVRGGKTLVAARAPERTRSTRPSTSSSATRAPGPRAPAGRARPFRRSRRSSRSPSARSRPAACASLPNPPLQRGRGRRPVV